MLYHFQNVFWQPNHGMMKVSLELQLCDFSFLYSLFNKKAFLKRKATV